MSHPGLPQAPLDATTEVSSRTIRGLLERAAARKRQLNLLLLSALTVLFLVTLVASGLEMSKSEGRPNRRQRLRSNRFRERCRRDSRSGRPPNAAGGDQWVRPVCGRSP